MTERQRYMAQRLSALVMVPLVLGHLAVMIYAVRHGLSTAEILGRTQGSVFWFAFYGLFVLAVSVHASLGLWVIAGEWLGLRGTAQRVFGWVTSLGLFYLGARAVWAVTWA